MFSRSSIAGALALLAAPIVVIVSVLIQTTLSGDSATQVAALTSHHGAMVAGLAVNLVALILLIAGLIWLALAVAPHAPRLALAGGVLSVFGMLVVLFENTVDAVGPAIVGTLDPAQAAGVLDRIHSGAIAALEPVSLIGDIGIALLGIAVVKAGAPRWAGAAIVIGALGQGAGFATGTKPLVIISFVLLFAGLLQAVRTLSVSSGSPVAARPAPAAAVT
jgi:hypothetical protein